MTVRINFWSGPRNVSTAMMYSWRSRSDTTVVDEPLYAHYLRVTGVSHPGRDETLASQDSDGEAVVAEQIMGPWPTPVVFFKQMAKHLVDIDRSFLERCHNILLIRDPKEMLTSFQKQVPDATLKETSLVELNEILDRALASGNPPVVIDSKILLGNPEAILTKACQQIGLEFEPAMLSWPAGPKPEDGSWAPYWYESVHGSTGWGAWRPKNDELLAQLEPVLAQAQPLYERLESYAIN